MTPPSAFISAEPTCFGDESRQITGEDPTAFPRSMPDSFASPSNPPRTRSRAYFSQKLVALLVLYAYYSGLFVYVDRLGNIENTLNVLNPDVTEQIGQEVA